mmetsp:Transcript_138749/g.241262  ORF Transcript_138749/g.241262 Transcript_138749/m.241262 type:complete len:103 (-) Transcript_138749:1432-1740(-)
MTVGNEILKKRRSTSALPDHTDLQMPITFGCPGLGPSEPKSSLLVATLHLPKEAWAVGDWQACIAEILSLVHIGTTTCPKLASGHIFSQLACFSLHLASDHR